MLRRAIIQGVKHLRRPKHEWKIENPIKKFTGTKERREALLNMLWIRGTVVAHFFNMRDYACGVAIPGRVLAILHYNGDRGTVLWPSSESNPILVEFKVVCSDVKGYEWRRLPLSNVDDINRFMEWIESFDRELINLG